jgi:ACS family tartrate transporter-like MFS transporter
MDSADLCRTWEYLAGPAVACGIALYNSIGNLGGFLGPYLIGAIKEATGSYAFSMMFIAFGLVISAGIVFLLGRAIAPRGAMAMPTAGAAE